MDYPGDVSTPTSDLTTMKLHVNSTISDVKARYICMGVKYFYLNSMMDRAEYIMIQIAMIPQEFADKYNLQEKVHNGYIYERVTKGVYGIHRAGRISNDDLLKHLYLYSYHPLSKNPGIWTHKN